MLNLMEGESDIEKSNCFICDKLVDFHSDQNADFDKLEKNLEMCHKFCTLVSRFLQFSCDGESVGNFKPRNTLNFESDGAILDLEQQICNGCFQKAEKFCDLYVVWTKVKLQLIEGVEDMTGLMKNAQTVSLDRTDCDNENMGAMGFRRMFLKQVQNRSKEEYPQLEGFAVPSKGPCTSQLQAPQQNDIQTKPELRFSCRFCFKRFSTWRNYKIHHTMAHKYLKLKRRTVTNLKRRPLHFDGLDDTAEVTKTGIYEENDVSAGNQNVVSSPSKNSGSTSKSNLESVDIEQKHEADVGPGREAGNHVDNAAEEDKIHEMKHLRSNDSKSDETRKIIISKTACKPNKVEANRLMMAKRGKKITDNKKTDNVKSAKGANKKRNQYQAGNGATNSTLMKKYEMRERKEKPNDNHHPVKNQKPNHENQNLHFKCNSCDKRFRTWRILKIHKTKEHKKLGNRSTKATNGETVENEEDKQFPCRYCGKKFRHQSGRCVHERGHKGIKPFKCDVCDKTWTTSSNLKVHLTNVHKLVDEEVKRLMAQDKERRSNQRKENKK